jgi:ketosteroid isomerase-like protein
MQNGRSEQLSPETIRAEIARFWATFASKAQDRLEEVYDPEAIVFSSSAKSSESGRLTVVRRSREYFIPQASLHHSLGRIDVQAIGEQAAIASYVFRFEAKNVGGSLGAMRDERIMHGRATQVFIRDHDGALRIVHEHFSAATP